MGNVLKVFLGHPIRVIIFQFEFKGTKKYLTFNQSKIAFISIASLHKTLHEPVMYNCNLLTQNATVL